MKLYIQFYMTARIKVLTAMHAQASMMRKRALNSQEAQEANQWEVQFERLLKEEREKHRPEQLVLVGEGGPDSE